MSSLTRKIERLARFHALLKDTPAASDTDYLMREACMVVEAIAAEYPRTVDMLRDRLPKLHQAAGTPQN